MFKEEQTLPCRRDAHGRPEEEMDLRMQRVYCDARDTLYTHQPWRGKGGFLEEVISKGDLGDEWRLPRERRLNARSRGRLCNSAHSGPPGDSARGACGRGGAVGVCGLEDERLPLVGVSWVAWRLQFWLAHLTHGAP